MTLTPEQVAENAKDGTQGPWETGACEDLSTFVTDASGNIIAHISTIGLEDTRRIASVPDMEALITKQAAEIERLREALDRVDRSLTNLQPKIANGLVSKEWVPVFDGYIDPAVEAVRTTLEELTGGKDE